MGIINITPDSFSDGGLSFDHKNAMINIQNLIEAGADIIDIGAQSTRPGAKLLSLNEEIKRLFPLLNNLRREFPNQYFSIDTYNSNVAMKALDAGIDLINDISGARFDKNILKVIRDYDCPYVLTHSRGNSSTMNELCNYSDVVKDVIIELNSKTKLLIDYGINRSNIIWDPGIGFAKNTSQNLKLLKNLEQFSEYGFPLLVGASRKRFIGEITNVIEPRERYIGTSLVVARCLQAGVSIVRVHNVKEAKETLLMSRALW